MTDRLTDAELEAVGDRARNGPTVKGVDGISYRGNVLALVAEVREHRAARTLTDEELSYVESARGLLKLHGFAALSDPHLLAIIDRITVEATDG